MYIVGIVRHWTTWSDDRKFHALVALVSTRSGSAALSTGLALAGPGSRWDGTPELELTTSENYETCWCPIDGLLPRLQICWFPWRSESGMRGDAQRKMKPNEKKTLWSPTRFCSLKKVYGWVRFLLLCSSLDPRFFRYFEEGCAFHSSFGSRSPQRTLLGLVVSDLRLSACVAPNWKLVQVHKFTMSQCAVRSRKWYGALCRTETSKYEPQCYHSCVRQKAPKGGSDWLDSIAGDRRPCRYFVQPGVYNLNRFRLFVVGMQRAENIQILPVKNEALSSSLWGLQAPSLPPSRLATMGLGKWPRLMWKGCAQDCESIL